MSVHLRWVLANDLFASFRQTKGDMQKTLFLSFHADSLHPYVSAMRIDGAPYRSTWLPLSLLKPGGTTELRFDMAARPDTAWGSAPQDAPPSFNTQDSR